VRRANAAGARTLPPNNSSSSETPYRQRDRGTGLRKAIDMKRDNIDEKKIAQFSLSVTQRVTRMRRGVDGG